MRFITTPRWATPWLMFFVFLYTTCITAVHKAPGQMPALPAATIVTRQTELNTILNIIDSKTIIDPDERYQHLSRALELITEQKAVLGKREYEKLYTKIKNELALMTQSRAPRQGTDTGNSASVGNIGTQFESTDVCPCGSGGGSGTTTDAFVNGGNAFSTPEAVLGTTNGLDLVIRTGAGTMPGQGRMAIASTGETKILAGNELQFFNPAGNFHTGIKAGIIPGPDLATLVLPTTDATTNQILSNDGSGNLSWVTVSLPTNTFVQNGNSFTAPAVLGTNDDYSLSFKTDNITRLTIANQTTGAGAITISQQSPTLGGELRFATPGAPANYSGFVANPSTTISNVWVLPANNGTNDQVLTTDGAGTLSWTNRGTVTTNKAAAYRGTDLVVGGTGAITVVFNTSSFNPGGNYATGTGIYTAPATGIYLVTAQVCVQVGNSGTKKINIFTTTPNNPIPGCTGKLLVPTFSYSTTITDTYTIPLSTMVSLTSGDQIRIVYTGDPLDTIIADGTELAVHFMST